MNKLTIKTEAELKIMAECGRKLGLVKSELRKAVKEGVRAFDIEQLAVGLIEKAGGKPSFKMVPGYHWATCVNVNSGLVHGIPKKEIIFKEGDLVSVDVGLYYKGFHSDTSFSVGVKTLPAVNKFLEAGKQALNAAIKVAKPGNRISDISLAIETTIIKKGYFPVRSLVGHGIGKNMHENPAIPCFVTEGKGVKIVPGMALAIEVMYTLGSPELVVEKDGWTISTRDGKISALYEETVAIHTDGPLVLTKG